MGEGDKEELSLTETHQMILHQQHGTCEYFWAQRVQHVEREYYSKNYNLLLTFTVISNNIQPRLLLKLRNK